MQKILLWGSVVLGLILMIWGLAKFGTTSTPGVAGSLTGEIEIDPHRKGNPDAKITLVEYSDFQCPACAATYPILSQLAKDFPNDVQIIYRHFPLRQIHPNAQLAAQAAEAAALQGKFWDMHDVLFNTQVQWASEPNPTDFFVQLASSIGLNTETFQNDLTSSDVKDAVNEDYASGTAVNIPGTPTIFLNGKQIPNPRSYDEFQATITAAIAAL